MRNYIILNNKNSNEITGLLIQTLPPISKPKIRTNIEEIDGRDGDIITKLGYSAYNKEITIGLYGNYNVDNVIKYFSDNQSGIVTFSNEEDKYYNYEILDQIDFERLIRYKTATVTLHCQPFKYSTTEEKIQINATEVSGSGSSITLNNTENGAIFTSLQINGDTSQSGTPTPSSPVPVNVVTGNNTISVCGKNLFDNNIGIKLNYSATGTKIDTGMKATQTTAGTYKYFTMILHNSNKLLNKTLTLSATISPSSNNIGRIGVFRIIKSTGLQDGTAIATLSETGSVSFTMPSTLSSIYDFGLLFYANTNGTGNINDYVDYTNVQLEENLTATNFEPYNSTDYSVNLGSIELCKIGDYQDYIYKENGNWYLHKEIGKKVYNGSENWLASATQISGSLKVYNTIPYSNNNETYISNVLSNLFVKIPIGDYTSALNTGICPQNGGINVCILDTTMSKDDFKTFLSTNNLIVCYNMTTPTDTQITDETLISDLETFLSTATTYLNQTNIITSGSDLDPLLDVTTYAIENPSFTITNSGNIYSKPIITVYGVGTVGLYLNGIQVLSLNMGDTTSQITIDVAKMEAYNQETGALMNRNVTGDYNNLSLNVGENTITESGTLQGLEIENYSRWL